MADTAKQSNKKPRRINGFQRPWHKLQVATWFLFALIICLYFAFLMQIMWNNRGLQIFLTVLFCFFATCAMVAVYLTCHTDPADNALIIDPSKRSPVQQSDQSLYCYNCEVQVHSSSKHCRYCDKCVERFDHHCKWLNTCIGRKNYRYFLSIIVSVGFLLSEVLAISIAVMVESFAYPNTSVDAIRGVLIGCIVVLLALIALVLQLAGFHAVLLYKGITTYEFIVQEQKRQRESEAAKVKAKKGKSVDERLAAAAAAAAQHDADIEMQGHSRTSLNSIEIRPQDSQEGEVSDNGPPTLRQYNYEPVGKENEED